MFRLPLFDNSPVITAHFARKNQVIGNFPLVKAAHGQIRLAAMMPDTPAMLKHHRRGKSWWVFAGKFLQMFACLFHRAGLLKISPRRQKLVTANKYPSFGWPVSRPLLQQGW